MPTIFERLASGELPCARVCEDALVFAFMDAGQVNDGHVIVATRRPVATLMDCSDDEAAALMRTARRVAIAVQQAFAPAGITVLQANRPAGWQTVPHLHLHVWPTQSPADFDPHDVVHGQDQQILAANAQKLRESLPALTKAISSIFVWGEEDPFSLPETGRAIEPLLPDVKFHWIADAGHQVQTDQPEEVARVIREFVLNG